MTGLTPTFGGNPVQPATVSYEAIALDADLALDWSSFALTGDDVVATIMEVTPDMAGWEIAMPPATQVGPGSAVLFRNLGSDTFTITDVSGNTIGTVAAGIAKYLYLTDNATDDGSWSIITFGTGSGSADAASLAGYGLKAITTTLNQAHVCVETAAAITITSASRATEYTATGGSVACNLPTAASVGDDFFFIIRNGGSGTLTLTPSGADTVDGAASLGMNPGDACFVFSSGTSAHWYTVGLGRSVVFAFTQLVKSVAGNTDVTLTASEAANKLITFTGVLTGNINVIVPNTASPYYIYNNTTGPYTLTVKTAAGSGVAIDQGTHDIAVCDAVNVYSAITNTTSSIAFNDGSAGSPSITFVGDTDTGLYHPAAGQLAFTSNGVQVWLADSNGITVTGGTVTASRPIGSWTQTWNNGAVTFTGFKINITDTASAAASLLADLQVGGSSRFKVDKSGVQTLNGNTAALPTPPTTTYLHVGGADTVAPGITIDAFGNGAVLFLRRAEGTNASKTAVQSGNVLGQVAGRGYDGTAYSANSEATLQLKAAQNWSVGAHGTIAAVQTTPNGSVTRQDVGIFGQDGSFSALSKLFPGTDAGAIQSAAGIYAGTGVPSNANGNNGDYYFRSDGGAMTHIYFRSAGTWAGIV